MEKVFYLNELYDLYKNLLTDKQQRYFMDYYFHNLSYGEIALKYGISRNAIYRQMRLIENKLNYYEKSLNLYSKKQKINDIITMIGEKDIKKELDNLF